jgi:PAS domain S-box-containing protein
VLPDIAERLSGLCAEVLRSNVPHRYESRGKDGRDLLVTLFRIEHDTVASSAVDITDHQRVRTALRANEQRFSALAEQANVAIVLAAMDGRFEYVNEAFCRMLGYTREELLQRTWMDVTHPDDLALDLAAGRRVLAGESTHYTMEKRYIRKDGAAVWVQLFGNFVFDDDGRPRQGVAIAVDTSERRRSDAALRESEERFRTLSNGIAQMAWTCDHQGHVTWYNDRWYEYTGCTAEQMLGEGWKAVVAPEHLERVSELYRQAVARGEAWEANLPIRRGTARTAGSCRGRCPCARQTARSRSGSGPIPMSPS